MLLDERGRKARTSRAAETPASEAPQRIAGAQVGRLVALDGNGAPLVDYPGTLEGPRAALLAARCPWGPLETAVGHHVVLLFEDGDPARPLIVAWVEEAGAQAVGAPRNLRVDGERFVVEAARVIELRCGEASLTLTADGRVLLKGKNLLAHAKQLNRIRGAAVRIN